MKTGKLPLSDLSHGNGNAGAQARLIRLRATETLETWDVIVKVHGGGPTGQSGAVRLGISRCLKKADETIEHLLREGGFLTRDGRMKERKKYGQKGARGKFQFSKR